MGSGVGIGLAIWLNKHDAATHITLHDNTTQSISRVEERVAGLDQKVESLTKLVMDMRESQSKIIQLLERRIPAQLDTRTTQDKTGKQARYRLHTSPGNQ